MLHNLPGRKIRTQYTLFSKCGTLQNDLHAVCALEKNCPKNGLKLYLKIIFLTDKMRLILSLSIHN